MDLLRLIGIGGLRLNGGIADLQGFGLGQAWFGGLRLNENQAQTNSTAGSRHDVGIHVTILVLQPF